MTRTNFYLQVCCSRDGSWVNIVKELYNVVVFSAASVFVGGMLDSNIVGKEEEYNKYEVDFV